MSMEEKRAHPHIRHIQMLKVVFQCWFEEKRGGGWELNHHTRTHRHTRTHSHTYIHTHARTHTCTHTHTLLRQREHTHTQELQRENLQIYPHKRTHTDTLGRMTQGDRRNDWRRERERVGERQFMPGVHEIMCLVMVHSYSLKDKFWELENVAQTLFTAHIEFLSSKHTLVSSFLRQSRTSEK